ncbi:MAG: hypothetical protein F4103_13295 [Boseongicola sp. SB0673_bin_14]|nr:hypothetical protein [Boseongicola sp. SB0667_bin_21]MYI69665.1 hypothetical protein [Boseongicola sp. SB0673_bin_14]
MTRISAFDRLKSLPEVFTTRSLPLLLGTDRRTASVCLARWRKRGFVSSLGPQAGIHFNLVANPKAASERRDDAIAHLFPGAKVGGLTTLWMEGWTTQRPQRTDLMVPSRPSFPKLHGVELHARPMDWFKMAKDHVLAPGPLPRVTPAFALADCWASRRWRPDPDDIEWDLVDKAKLERAFDLFGMSLPEHWTSDPCYIHEMDERVIAAMKAAGEPLPHPA